MLATVQLSRIASDETFDTPKNNTKTVETFRYGLEKLEDSHKHADGLNREIDQYDINLPLEPATPRRLPAIKSEAWHSASERCG